MAAVRIRHRPTWPPAASSSSAATSSGSRNRHSAENTSNDQLSRTPPAPDRISACSPVPRRSSRSPAAPSAAFSLPDSPATTRQTDMETGSLESTNEALRPGCTRDGPVVASKSPQSTTAALRAGASEQRRPSAS
ncbi:hypothetical protein CGC20_36605 [Leishmania donovani]|uniref:Uncharacterized protein n=1 Tax=Leishmania donovani TaxID=5661 RepID=A0A504X4G1_LEIDO|nr:hypothetical protein CGC20_36605 [Leishmania donovani]